MGKRHDLKYVNDPRSGSQAFVGAAAFALLSAMALSGCPVAKEGADGASGGTRAAASTTKKRLLGTPGGRAAFASCFYPQTLSIGCVQCHSNQKVFADPNDVVLSYNNAVALGLVDFDNPTNSKVIVRSGDGHGQSSVNDPKNRPIFAEAAKCWAASEQFFEEVVAGGDAEEETLEGDSSLHDLGSISSGEIVLPSPYVDAGTGMVVDTLPTRTGTGVSGPGGGAPLAPLPNVPYIVHINLAKLMGGTAWGTKSTSANEPDLQSFAGGTRNGANQLAINGNLISHSFLEFEVVQLAKKEAAPGQWVYFYEISKPILVNMNSRYGKSGRVGEGRRGTAITGGPNNTGFDICNTTDPLCRWYNDINLSNLKILINGAYDPDLGIYTRIKRVFRYRNDLTLPSTALQDRAPNVSIGSDGAMSFWGTPGEPVVLKINVKELALISQPPPPPPFE